MTASVTNWKEIAAELKGIEIISDRDRLTKLSLDYYYFSPILFEQLKTKRGDLAVLPTTEAEVIRIAKTCVKYRVPLTVREQELAITVNAFPCKAA